MMTAYTDGACSGNPGPGGWGVLLIIDGQEPNYAEAKQRPPITVWSLKQQLKLYAPCLKMAR